MADHQLEHHEVEQVIQKFPICILANDFSVPMNVGSLFRLADALGISKIYLCGSSPVPPNRKINKTARSTVKYVDYEYVEDPMTVVEQLKTDDYTIVSLEITQASVDIRQLQIAPSQKVCLIVGAESEGIRQELLDHSDQVVHIPMFGHNSSMNVATATAIALFEIAKFFSSISGTSQ